jgi:EAL domain-containing protein (putative c-di-GMP-specific phosphodiesterase class I)
VVDVSQYLLYEAADAALRVENCKLDLKVMLKMIPDFYLQGSQLQLLNQLFKDQPISRDRLLLTIPAELVLNANKGTLEILDRYLRNGVALVLDDYHPDKATANKLRGMGFSYIRVSGEHNLRPETSEMLTWMKGIGFTVIGSGADTHDAVKWLAASGVAFMRGTLTGVAVSEDELIRDSLARER